MSHAIVLEREADGEYEGDDPQKSLSNINEAIEVYLEDCESAKDWQAS
jgi:hypothetical protein